MTTTTVALFTARWLNFVATAGLFGASLFPLYAPAADATCFATIRARRFLFGIAVVVGLTTVAWAAASLAHMADDIGAIGDWYAWSAFFFETSFGNVWILRIGLSALLLLATLIPPRRPALYAAITLSAGLLVSQAWIGHPAALPSQIRWLVTAGFSLHVLSAGAWIGGLAPLAFALNSVSGDSQQDRRAACHLLERFSIVGLVAVSVILLGGVVNAAAHIANLSSLLSSSWGHALIIKLALVGVMLGLASLNRFVLMPRLSLGEAKALVSLRRSVAAEQATGLLVLAATAALGMLDPAG